eukprot:scaffold2566_cov125-Alexandrium_tamarense.AAC.22
MLMVGRSSCSDDVVYLPQLRYGLMPAAAFTVSLPAPSSLENVDANSENRKVLPPKTGGKDIHREND